MIPLDSDGIPFEYTVPVRTVTSYSSELSIVIAVSKLGGGTRGRAYEGTWEYSILVNGAVFFTGVDLHTGTARTHAQVARLVAGFAASWEGESWLTPVQAEFLASESSRLSDFSES